jgi:hypothetical protein
MALPVLVAALGIGARAWKAYSAAKKLKILKKAKKAGAKKASKVRKDKNQPKKGQKEMFRGKGGPDVKRPEGKVQDGWYEKANKQLDLFDKKANRALKIKKHK